MPTLALLDGHNLAFRAFFALPADLATSTGQVTNAVYGFTSMVIKLLGDEHPDAVAVAWDSPKKTFRAERYSEYKAQRDEAPDLFRSQMPLIHEVADVLRLPQLIAPGWEADDIIATVARAAARAGWEVLVVSGDRDAFQLIDDHIRIYYPKRGITETIVADAAYVLDRYGITPEQYPDYAALRGDTSDNLPGVPGVGEKTASRLIAGYGRLEGLYEHLDEQTPKLKASLAEWKEQVFLNRELSRLVDDVAVETDPEALRLQSWDPQEVRRVFDGLAFRSLWQRLQEIGGAEPEPEAVLEVEVGSGSGAEALRAAGAGLLALDPVWDGDDLVGLVVGRDDGATFVPFDRLGTLVGALADPAVPKALHDAKPLLRALMEADLDLQGLAFDTQLAAFVINPDAGTQALPDLAGRVLGIEIAASDEASPSGKQGTLSFDQAGPDLEGAARRVTAVARLVEPLRHGMDERGLSRLFDEVELPLVRVLARMEHAGIAVDRPYLEELGESLRDRLATLQDRIFQAAGEPFNINSTLQLREVLYDRLKLPVLKKTAKGQPSTDAAVLQKLADQHPVVDHLLRFRELEKLRSTYVDGLLPLIAADGRIHCVFNQTGASTGRISSEQPNMQNIPVRSEEGRTIRRAFVAAPGQVFVVADYSQIELRILAHICGDAALVAAFQSGADVHTETARRVFGVSAEAVTPEMRRRAKTINFGLLYGMEAYGLAQRLEIPQDEARSQMEAYFAQFPGVADFMHSIVVEARNRGYTETILGRRRYLPELVSGNFRERQAAERMALNAPIQGSAADIIKQAMIVLDVALDDLGAAMLLQVHDELVIEAPAGRQREVMAKVHEVMEGVVELRVPLVADVGVGPNLADAKH